MSAPTLSPTEASFIKSLIALYKACSDSGPCVRDCQCERCVALDSAGGHLAETFDTLSSKVGLPPKP